MALHYRETTYKEILQAPQPRPGYSPSPPKALQYGKTSCNETFQAPRPRLVARPSLWRCTMRKQPTRKHSICLSYVDWVASPYLVAYVVTAPWRSNQQRCLQRKKVQGVLTGVVCSVTKRLALHCIATSILSMQRIFPHIANQKQDRKMHSGLREG